MKVTRRQLSAWVLLAVYLPMLLLSSLHVHGSLLVGEEACTECVQHQCHGHLAQLSGEMHQCVLCQILSLTYIAAATGLPVFLLTRLSASPCPSEGGERAVVVGFVSLRAPPQALV